MRVKIKCIPKAKTGYQVNGSLVNDIATMGGSDRNSFMNSSDPKASRSLSAVPRHKANLEAEGGETVVGNLDNSMLPAFKNINGPRHSSGGVPLNLPKDSFIFSDTKDMKINDPDILKTFGKSGKKGSYTPAQLSKQFDLQKYREILENKDSDKADIKTAELMIKNYTLKLGALALAQESKKGFPQGIPEVAKPYLMVNGISEETFVPNENPVQMPNGQPVAVPMAMYGMQSGNNDSENYFKEGGVNDRPLTLAELEERRKKQTQIRKQKGTAPEGYVKLSDGTYAKGVIKSGEPINSTLGQAKKSSSNKPSSNWSATICGQLKKGVTPEQLAQQGHGTVAGLTSQFADCIKKGQATINNGQEELDFLQLEEDPNIVAPNTITSTKTIVGDCECTKQDGTKYNPGKNTNGTCKECLKSVSNQGTYVQNPPKQPAQWWLQDSINTLGAFGDMMSNTKYMPWEARVDLEEPRPTFLDPTRELAAQSEQANIASQAAAQFAGPQALNARLSGIQGQGARSAADTLSRINNQNVNIANQFENQQVGIRNQENMMNQQMANRVYDKNVVTNQQFDNSKKLGRANMRQAYTNAITNRAKTDALNQMYPNYQTDPSTGGFVKYTPTEKNVDPGAEELDAIRFADSIMKYPEATQKLLWQQRYGKKAGGQVFQKGGFVYSVFPIMTL